MTKREEIKKMISEGEKIFDQAEEECNFKYQEDYQNLIFTEKLYVISCVINRIKTDDMRGDC
jgi:hypothetical protein